MNKSMKKFKEMTDDELTRQIEEIRKEGFNLRGQAKRGQLENSAGIRTARRNLARIMTEQKLRSAKA